MSTKELFSCKSIMNTRAAYLVLHTCISLSSNCQQFVSNSPYHSYCSLLPLDAIHFVNITAQNTAGLLYVHLMNTQPLTAAHHASDKQLYTDPDSRLSITHSARHFGRDGVLSEPRISVRFFCLEQLWNVFVFPSSAAHKNQHSVVVLCIIVW